MKDDAHFWLSMKGFLIMLAVIVTIWFAYWYAIGHLYGVPDSPGSFGDMFGALNGLFSGLAFAALIYAVFLQRRELELQRKELELTRKEVERLAKAQEHSERTLRNQAEIMAIAALVNAAASLDQLIGKHGMYSNMNLSVQQLKTAIKILGQFLDNAAQDSNS